MNPTWEANVNQAEALVHVIETAMHVCRRYQFFVWTQSSLQSLLPHTIAVCGVYERSRKQVQLEVFNSVVVPAPLLVTLADGQSPFMQGVLGLWADNQGHALTIDLSASSLRAGAAEREALQAEGFEELLVHGVSRPQRASEIESFFLLASPGQWISERQRIYIELLLPHLHRTYLRVQVHEREMNTRARTPAAAALRGYSHVNITTREVQILTWVRQGMSNLQIGAQLGISPLTVKNHVQKILRKLGANNRAQAVALAMSMNLLGHTPSEV